MREANHYRIEVESSFYTTLYTIQKLAEGFLRDQGFHDVRVRHHENSQGASIARIEFGEADFKKALDVSLLGRIGDQLRTFGYDFVALDVFGYSRGSLNASILPAKIMENVRFVEARKSGEE